METGAKPRESQGSGTGSLFFPRQRKLLSGLIITHIGISVANSSPVSSPVCCLCIYIYAYDLT